MSLLASSAVSFARSCSSSWMTEQFLSIRSSRVMTAALSSISSWVRVTFRSSSRTFWMSLYVCFILSLITKDLFWLGETKSFSSEVIWNIFERTRIDWEVSEESF
ncbi:hypothetical protein DPEC_G00036700 [Dallia pectoralis]|uniref:Uncharacterized protein n=1 Tax=Dallia pectoralis TaxID=75939 RepID=A0ACC2HDQ1_DALPE|nr:hypothetical protein DPEC_G00036700 [Dallia pectoralis]